MIKTLICILGPTAVGKTETAIKLAQQLNTEIISADSRQFYKELNIGTAKPTETELLAATHHFIGHKSVAETYTAGDFERDALNKLSELFKKHDTVIAVGGSGLYVKALIDGLDDMPQADENLRLYLNNLYKTDGINALTALLKSIDINLYNTTELQNPQRVMRAIEIGKAVQNGFKVNNKKAKRDFKTLKIVINRPREELYERINSRVDSMMQAGLLDEVKQMLPYRNVYALQTVGYTELFDYLNGNLTLDNAIHLIKQHSRNYAKKQITWFKKEAPQNWFLPTETDKIIELYKNPENN